MKKLDKLVDQINAKNNIQVPWTPETGRIYGYFYLDYYQPGDNKTPYRLVKTQKSDEIIFKGSAQSMEHFLQGFLFGITYK